MSLLEEDEESVSAAEGESAIRPPDEEEPVSGAGESIFVADESIPVAVPKEEESNTVIEQTESITSPEADSNLVSEPGAPSLLSLATPPAPAALPALAATPARLPPLPAEDTGGCLAEHTGGGLAEDTGGGDSASWDVFFPPRAASEVPPAATNASLPASSAPFSARPRRAAHKQQAPSLAAQGEPLSRNPLIPRRCSPSSEHAPSLACASAPVAAHRPSPFRLIRRGIPCRRSCCSRLHFWAAGRSARARSAARPPRARAQPPSPPPRAARCGPRGRAPSPPRRR